MKYSFDYFCDFFAWFHRNSKPPTDLYVMPNQTFEQWFNTLGIKHFSASEFLVYFNTHRRGVTNSPPPREMWTNIVPTLRIIDELREFFGRPIVVLSSYRSPAYNAAIDGAATKSYHMQFRALDIAVSGKTPSQVFAILKKWRDSGKFKGGLGLYSTFVHIDTRGYNATW